jgi:hypothetical protein
LLKPADDDEICDDDMKANDTLMDSTVEKPLAKTSLFCFFCIK